LPFLDLGDHRVEFAWHGPRPGDAPTLVFLHEGLGSIAAWRDFPARLAEASGCGAVVWSRRGYGGSDPAPRPWPVEFMHREARAALPAVLDRLEVRAAVLVGHSDGASIALIHAGDAGATPRVRGLLLEAPHVFVEDVCIRQIERAAAAYASGELRQSLSRIHADADATFAAWSGVWLDPAFRAWNIVESLPRVAVPVLAIQGSDDPYGTLRQVETVAASAGGFVEALVLSGCGHAPHREQPERTLASMVSFLRNEIFGRS
jgi:pimeloyl-ACP methyl ester carboxylesterase